MTKTITVKGIGRLSVAPDLIEIKMEMESIHKDYDKAMALASKRLTQLSDSLVSIGFEKRDIKTTDFNVQSDYEYQKDKHGNSQRVFVGFNCTHRLKVSFDLDMKRLSMALNTISKCLANPEFTISFTVKDPDAINQDLLRSATLNAKRKAEVLCEASGYKLGQLLSIDYNWGEINIKSKTTMVFADEMDFMASPMPLGIEPDDIKLSDTATFVWEIEY